MIKDGLWDAYKDVAHGSDLRRGLCAKEKGITRAAQDAFASRILPGERCRQQAEGKFRGEIVSSR